MKRSILIFEPCLGATSGHWENLAESFTESFSKNNFHVTFFGNKDQSHRSNKNLPVRPHFDQLPYVDYSKAPIMTTTKKNYLRSFLNINIDEFGPRPILVFSTLFPPIIEAALSWLMKLIEYDKIKPEDVIFIFLFPYTASACHQKNILKESPFRQFYSVSPQMIKCFEDQYNVPVRELPMPIYHAELPAITPKTPNQSIKIGYFGHASTEKGFFFLHPLTQLIYNRPVEFHYHLNTNPDTEVAAQVFKQPIKNVHCYWGHLSKQEMTRLMAQMDILLMPYKPSMYKGMPSAMFSEALLLGKVLVIPDNTWLSEQTQLFQAGATTFKNHSIDSLHQALALAVEQFEILQPLSRIAREAFRQYHNVDNFVNIMLKNRAEADSIAC